MKDQQSRTQPDTANAGYTVINQNVIVAATLAALMSIVFALADASLVFNGRLQQWLPMAVGMALSGAVLAALIVVINGGFKAAISGSQEAVLMIMASISIEIQSSLPASASEQQLLATVVFAIMLATFVGGVSCWLVGRYKLGRFIRFIPFPVTAGFLGGAGCVIAIMSLQVSSGSTFDLTTLKAASAGTLLKMGFGFVIAVLLLLAARFVKSAVAMPCILIGAALMFYLLNWVAGNDVQNVIDAQWTLSQTSQSISYPINVMYNVALIDWLAVIAIGPQVVLFAVVLLAASLIKISANEVMFRHEVDQNKELQAVGVSNIVCGLVGGFPGFHTLSQSMMPFKFNAGSKSTVVLYVIFLLVGTLLLSNVMIYLPRFVFGGLLLWVGIELIIDSVIKPMRTVGRVEAIAIVCIAGTIAAFGLTTGIVFGLAVSMLLFIVNYGNINIVRNEYAGHQLRSTIERHPAQVEIIQHHSANLRAFRIQGYIFFGSAYRLVEQIKARLDTLQDSPPEYLLIDLEKVTGIDSSALQTFLKLEMLAESQGFTLLLSGGFLSSTDDGKQLTREGAKNPSSLVRFFDSMDQAMEWWEEQLLSGHSVDVLLDDDAGLSAFLNTPAVSGLNDRLQDFMQERTLSAGEVLIRQGSEADQIYFISAGVLDIEVQNQAGDTVRVRQVGPGASVGELSFYLGGLATATVVSLRGGTVWGLSKAGLKNMLSRSPELASAFHERMSGALAHRLSRSNDIVRHARAG